MTQRARTRCRTPSSGRLEDALPSCLLKALWGQFAALLPSRDGFAPPAIHGTATAASRTGWPSSTSRRPWHCEPTTA